MQFKEWRRLHRRGTAAALPFRRNAAALRSFAPGRSQLALAALTLSLGSDPVCAVELVPPEKLEAQTGLHSQSVTVVEPHEPEGGRHVTADYRGFPIQPLLDGWFGASWKAPDAEVVFLAKDGYRSVIGGARLRNYPAYLAFARTDGAPFVVDNPAQHQTRVPLGPYYLIWDNRDRPDLLQLGSVGWPYQVSRIEWRSASEDAALMPPNPSEEVRAGFLAAKDHCLTCHRIRGVGGEKYPADLERAVCRWSDEGLKSFIDHPDRLRPATTMPAFDGQNGSEERKRSIDHIVAYLNAIKAADASCTDKLE